MNFLEFAVWGAYLTSMGSYLVTVGLARNIAMFYAVQGIVSIFMPGLIGIVADRWIPAQRLLGICHFLAGGFIAAAAFYGMQAGEHVELNRLFLLYAMSVAFYMPTLALGNSVAFSTLTRAGYDTVKDFPPRQGFRNDRLHLYDACCRCFRFSDYLWAVFCLGGSEHPSRILCTDIAFVSGEWEWRK